MANHEIDHARTVSLVHCEECTRKCVDVGSRAREFGWRSETVAGVTRWRCTGCLGGAPSVAVFATLPGLRTHAA